MIWPRYPTGEEIHAGDRIVFQGRGARVLFIKRLDGQNEFAAGVAASNWDFIPARTIFVEFESGDCCGYDGFCEHDGVRLLARQ